MSIKGIQGQLLEVTVVAGDKLKDTEWVSKQDPYVRLEYGGTKFTTRTCTDGHTDPVFQEKFPFLLIEGLRELTCEVWNSNTIQRHIFIGSAKVLLQRVLSRGYDDSAWPLQDKNGRYAGQVRLILRYENNVLQPATSSFAHDLSSLSSCRPSVTQPIFQDLHNWCSPTTAANPYPTPAPAAPYAPPARPYPPPSDPRPYPPPSDPYSSYLISNAAVYQPFPYSAPPSAVYPPPPIFPLNLAYPPSLYPPAPQFSHSLYPPGPYQGTYPPPPF